ncbi:GNAT family N-acetyltransferase [Streptomyces sp. NPDC001985]|uniref:GNAT family N-acetyltransferase n=1 Tax=Streptomyces sp. NPDC001985 TaxID=3154406 RepID=UPI00331C3AFA
MTRVATGIRPLGPAELPACLRLAESHGWPAEIRAWEFLFATGAVHGTEGERPGELAGVVASVRYGTAVTTVGGMLVAERYGRQGLGSRLMRHAVDRAPADTVWLTATAPGRPLYERLGFRPVGTLVRFSGRPGPVDRAGDGSRPAVPADLPAIIALDTEVFGADRSPLLTLLASVATGARVAEGPRGLTGYAMTWSGVGFTVVGPLIAESTETAVGLLDGLTDPAAGGGGPLRIDIGRERAGLREWALARGLREGGTTAVMIRGGPLPGDRSRLFTPVTGALG